MCKLRAAVFEKTNISDYSKNIMINEKVLFIFN